MKLVLTKEFPLENMGAELELYLAPPTVPGLTFKCIELPRLLKLVLSK